MGAPIGNNNAAGPHGTMGMTKAQQHNRAQAKANGRRRQAARAKMGVHQAAQIAKSVKYSRKNYGK